MRPVKLSSGVAMACAMAAVLLPSLGHADGAFRTVLVIDASSSMKRTDPGELRKAAAELFVDLARNGDEIAVTGFDGSARQSTGGFTIIDGSEARQRLKDAIRAVGNDGQWTDFTAGLGEARQLLAGAGKKPGDQELVLFLTDGKCEPDPASELAARGKTPAEREAACQAEVLDRLARELDGARVYAIGLSKRAPAAFLEELGRRTGGQGAVTLEPQELPRLFADVYARLLGSRLQEGSGRGKATFTVYEGAESLDLVLAGATAQTERLVDPDGREIAIDNRDSARVYFSGTAAYRFYKIGQPRPGTWTVELAGAAPGRFVTLQHFDLELALVDPPAVVELGQSVSLRARLSTAAGTVPPAEFLDRHRLLAVIRAGQDERSDIQVALARSPDGTFTAAHTPAAMGTLGVRLKLEPGPDGMLQRSTGELARVTVIPPMQLAAAPVQAGAVKQGAATEAMLSLAGSKLGAAVEVDLALAPGASWLTMSPDHVSLAADGSAAADGTAAARQIALRLAVAEDAPAGPARVTLTLLPRTPAGFPGDLTSRKVEVEIALDVVPLTFWERYGRLIQYGTAGLVTVILLLGWLLPARFKKRAILYYKDVRDPELPRQSSYPLGVKARPGLFRSARAALGPSGPVRRGNGVVILEAVSGGAIEARPASASATVYKAPISDDEAQVATEGERPRVSLSKGRFRMAPGTGYEIEGSGLVFWYK